MTEAGPSLAPATPASPSSPPRLKATRTYGRARPRHSSPEFGSFSTSSWPDRSSSPMPSSLLVTPPSSPPRPTKRPRVEIATDDDDDGNELAKDLILGETTVKKENFPSIPTKAVPGGKQGTLKGFFTAVPRPKAKLPLQPAMTVLSPSPNTSTTSSSSITSLSSSNPSTSRKSAQIPNLQQSHLMHLPLLQSCKACGMTYVRGGEDEGVHARHHGRVMRGIPWEGLGRRVGKSQGKRADKGDKGWKELAEVTFGSGANVGRGRVVVCDGSWGGVKLEDILATVDLSLSSPPLPPAILDRCRIFLLLTSSPPPPPKSASGKRQRPDPVISGKGRSSSGGTGERIVSIVVAQGIKWAMRVLPAAEVKDGVKRVKVVDSGGGVLCDPAPLDTPLGIHRLYTIPSYRSLGLAQVLLESTRENTVYGCSFDPAKGQVAFSQPTESGRAAMERWGGGAVRVFVDDESQI